MVRFQQFLISILFKKDLHGNIFIDKAITFFDDVTLELLLNINYVSIRLFVDETLRESTLYCIWSKCFVNPFMVLNMK